MDFVQKVDLFKGGVIFLHVHWHYEKGKSHGGAEDREQTYENLRPF